MAPPKKSEEHQNQLITAKITIKFKEDLQIKINRRLPHNDQTNTEEEVTLKWTKTNIINTKEAYNSKLHSNNFYGCDRVIFH